ncbi:MAG: hypothetical protein HQM02_00460 [Magnetococcales bacterium]|nr:hypothetical protein [Magnetococcales bacterium]
MSAATPLLDEAEEDAFKELYSLSFGKAASTLSEMLDTEVFLSLPQFSMLSRQSLVEYVRSLHGSLVNLVSMPYRFVFSPDDTIPGMAVLLIRSSAVASFLEALYGTPMPEDMANIVEAEAMSLTGDVLLYTCVSSLSAFFSSEIDSEKPKFFKGIPDDLPGHLAFVDAPDQLLLLRVDFHLQDREVAGSLLTWMDGDKVPCLRTEIAHFMRQYMT